ncbi:MAG: hypothetical protein GW859_05545 [Sphingomonadales bacterium]|nr:hypothetical protein [Sphingomonadales bacterium]
MCVALVASDAEATDPQLVPDVSQTEIEIRYSFAGEKLLLFGAILYPDGNLPDADVDIVVVLKSPSAPITIREKSQVGGIWLNVDAVSMRSAPTFYAIGSSRPIGDIVDERTAAIYELGLDNLQLSPTGFVSPEELGRFEAGLIDLNRRNRLYSEDFGAVSIREGVLYRASLAVPARVPVGRITAETFLISNGRVLAVASRDIVVRKTGFERFVAIAARQYGFLYGLAAILISLAFGYAASAYFARR